MRQKNKKYPEGHFVGKWMGIGMAIFSGFGIPLSISIENSGLIGIGPAMGVAFGVAIGKSIEAKYKKEGKIRPLRKKEKKNRKVSFIIALLALLLGLVAFLYMLSR